MNRNFLLSMLIPLVIAAGNVPASARQVERTRQQPPPAAPLPPIQFPVFHERTLRNGAQVVIVEDAERPVVSVGLRIRAGSVSDPTGRIGVASLTAGMLDKGTASRSAREIAESIDFVGGSISATGGYDWTTIGATVLTEFLDTALVLLGDVVMNPAFPAEEFETQRQRSLSSLQVELSNPGQLAQRRFFGEVYGAHPYGASTSSETLGAIGREDLVAFHAAHYRPGNALFVIAGDIRPDDAIARLERHFGAWQGAAATRSQLPAPPTRDRTEIVLVHRPGAVQAALRIGQLLPPASHPDWVALDVAEEVLGGGTGWLFRVLRGEKGYTYGAYASTVQRLDPGFLMVQADVRNEVADSALTDALRLIRQLREEAAPEGDLRRARDFITGSFPLTIETPQQVAGQVASSRMLGQPADYIVRYRDRIAAVSAAEVQRVSRAHIDPDRAVIVVVGDAAQLREKLLPFGPVRVVDAAGRPVDVPPISSTTHPAAPRVSAASAPRGIDPGVIMPQIHEYELRYQGSAVARTRTAVARDALDGRDRVLGATATTGLISIRTEVVFDARSFEPIFASGEQQMGSDRIRYELRAQDGRITGSVTGPDGTTRVVDEPLLPGMLLPGMSEFAVWLVDMAPGATFTFPAFSIESEAAADLVIRVVGQDRITVGAGEFDVWELEVSGGGPAMKLFARKDSPHFVVRQDFTGQPVTLELLEIRS